MMQLSITFPKHLSVLSPDELYAEVSEWLLPRLAEDRRLERKPAGVHSTELGDYICMWANTVPDGGLIVIGMEDKGALSGCHHLSSDRLNALEKAHYTYAPDAKVESPGGFPPLVTPENIYESHHPRNPTLMRAMWYMGLVKEHAEGTKRMRDSMAGMHLAPPTFQQTETGIGFSAVRVILRNSSKQRKEWVDADVTTILGDALAKNLTLEEKRILNFVAEHGRINVLQCHRLIPSLAKWHSAKKLLQKLAEKGLLKHVHSETVVRDSRAYYKLPDAFVPPKN